MSEFTYAHTCQDGHERIGHNDSEHEFCPLCRALMEAEHYKTQFTIQVRDRFAFEATIRDRDKRIERLTQELDESHGKTDSNTNESEEVTHD